MKFTDMNDIRFTTLFDPYLDDFMFRSEPQLSNEDMMLAANESREREISCTFNVVNRHTLQPRVRINLSRSPSFSLGIGSEDVSYEYRINIVHDSEECIKALRVTVKANNMHSALFQCRSVANTFLSWIVLYTMEPADIVSVEIYDHLTKIRWIGNLLGIAEMLPIRSCELSPIRSMRQEHRLALGLFREACTTTSPFYSLLSSYKILEGAYERQIFKLTHQLLTEKGISERRTRGSISLSMIEQVGTHNNKEFENLEGLTFQEYQKYLSGFRHKLAHPLLADDTKVWNAIITDDFDQRIEAGFHARLAKQVVQEVLVEEFRLLEILEQNPQKRRSCYE